MTRREEGVGGVESGARREGWHWFGKSSQGRSRRRMRAEDEDRG